MAAFVISATVLSSTSAVWATETTTAVQTASTKSKDNSLSSLSLSEGTLSPSFKYSTTSYTATVPNDVTSVEVNATTSNSNATIKKITGNDNLKVGENTITIKVKSEAGTKAIYTIVLTREAADSTTEETEETTEEDTTSDSVTAGSSEEAAITYQDDGTFLIDEKTYNVSQDFSDDKILDGFEKATVTLGSELTGMQDSASGVKVLYLVNASDSTDTRYIVVDETAESYENYLKMSSGDYYVIAVPLPIEATVPDNYSKASLDVKGVTLTLYEPSTGGEFYLFYGVNEDGTGAWYQYDATEESYQRYNEDLTLSAANSEYVSNAYDELKEKYTDLQGHYRLVLILAFAAIVALIVVIVNIFLRRNRDDEDEEEEENLQEIQFEEEPRRRLRRRRSEKQQEEPKVVAPAEAPQGGEDEEPLVDLRKDITLDDFEEKEYHPEEEPKQLTKPEPEAPVFTKEEHTYVQPEPEVTAQIEQPEQTPATEAEQVAKETAPKKSAPKKKQMDFDDIMDLNDL